ESIHTVGSMFGVLCEPAETNLRSECCVLFLNAGAVGHSGPNRMWTDAARRNAARGVVSFRFDLPGIGESDGDRNLDIPSLYQEALVEQVELAMDSLRSRLGVRRFIAIGLCSGAFWAFCAAIRNRDVCSAVLLNPRLFFWDPEVDRRRLVRRNAARLANGSQWRRILRGEMSLENVKAILGTLFDRSGSNWKGAFRTSQIPGRRMADAWKAIERNGSRVTLIFTDGEPLLCEMEQEGQMPPENPRVRLVRMGSAGHTFRPQWSQKLAHDLIDREIECAASMPEVRAVLT
ncbi:MAG: alpha/beta fold hydrolase, partial [Acidobacteriia bacterium]|nr:alpha/beta fold hydrolase [Terriglobia bacterium]